MKHHFTKLFMLIMVAVFTGCLLEDGDSGEPTSELTRDQRLAAPETSEEDPALDADDPEAIGQGGEGCFRTVNGTRKWSRPCRIRVRIRERGSGADY